MHACVVVTRIIKCMHVHEWVTHVHAWVGHTCACMYMCRSHTLSAQGSCRYIQRFDGELETIVELQSGKSCMASYHRLQHASKEDTLRQVIQRETQLFQSSGFGAYILFPSFPPFPSPPLPTPLPLPSLFPSLFPSPSLPPFPFSKLYLLSTYSRIQ